MEITPFITKVSFEQYIASMKPETKVFNHAGNTIYSFTKPVTTNYYNADRLIIGYVHNLFSNKKYCMLIDINNADYNGFIDSNSIDLYVEVVLKSELKDIKTVEQLNLFANEQKEN